MPSAPPLVRYPSAKFILRGQALGFSFLLVLMWVGELFRLPYYLLGDTSEFLWSRLAIRTFSLLSIWLIVHFTTARLLKRLHELETFLHICSWCRKVGDHGEWRTMEDYFDTRFHTSTSHGICPACAKAQLAKHRVEASRKVEKVS